MVLVVVGAAVVVLGAGVVVSAPPLHAEATSSRATAPANLLTVRVCHPSPEGGGGDIGAPRASDLSRSLRTGGHAPPMGVRTCEWGAEITLPVVSPDPRVLGCIDPRTSRPATACIRVAYPETGQRNSLRSSLCIWWCTF